MKLIRKTPHGSRPARVGAAASCRATSKGLRRAFALLWACLSLLALPAAAATIYLCKPYTGNPFWSTQACSQQQATAQSFHEVPSHLSFVEQVALADAQRQAQQRAAPPPSTGLTGILSGPVPGSEKECERLKERIKELEQMQRQVVRQRSLESIATERDFHRERVSQLRCR